MSNLDLILTFIREKGRKVLTSDAIELYDKHVSIKELTTYIKQLKTKE